MTDATGAAGENAGTVGWGISLASTGSTRCNSGVGGAVGSFRRLLDQVGQQQHVVVPGACRRRGVVAHLGPRLVVRDDLADRGKDIVHRGVVAGALGVAHLLPLPETPVRPGPVEPPLVLPQSPIQREPTSL